MEKEEKQYKLTAPTPQELNQELITLHNLKIIEYKIMNENKFSVAFTKEFVDFTDKNRDKIIEQAKDIAINMIKKEPEMVDAETAEMTYYSTTFIAYLKSTYQLGKLDLKDIQFIGRLVARVEEINEMDRD